MSVVTVRHRLLAADRDAVAGRTVTAELITPTPWLADGTASVVDAAEEVSGNDGGFELKLGPQAEQATPGTHYRIRIDGSWVTYYCVVPVSVDPVLLVNILVDPATLEPVEPELAAKWLTRAELGQPGGVAPLGGDGLVPPEHLPPTGGGAVDTVNGQTGTVVLDAGDVGALTQDQADDLYAPIGSIAANPLLGKTFSPAEHGAVGDGITDDWAAVRAAWDAMWTWLRQFPKKQNYANFYIPPDKHYRVDTSNGAR